jgi:hypothetical protein
MNRANALGLSLLLVIVLGSAASCKDDSECLRNSDCTREQFCQLGTCVRKPTSNDGLGDAGSADTAGSGGRPVTTGGRANSGGSNTSGGTTADSGRSAGGLAGESGASNG